MRAIQAGRPFLLVVFLFVSLAFAAQAPKKAPSGAEKPPATTPAITQPKEMTPAEVEAGWKAGRRILLIDVRPPREFNSGHPEDAINVPLPRFVAHMKQLQVPKPTELVIICRSAGEASLPAGELAKMGYSKVFYTTFEAWQKSGFRIDKFAPAHGTSPQESTQRRRERRG